MIIQVNCEQMHGLSIQFHVILWTVYGFKHRLVSLVSFGMDLNLIEGGMAR